MSENADPGRRPGFVEFVILVALIISLVALSIDAMLPARTGGSRFRRRNCCATPAPS